MTWDSLCASLLFLSVVCGLYAGAAAQVDSDNVLTLEEQMYLVIQASRRCDSSIQDKLNHSDDGDCPPEWDGFVCWPSAKPGSVVTLPCPAYIFDFNHEGHVVRWCSDNGTWLIASQKNRTMVDYSQCEKVMPESKEMEMYRRLSTIYTVGYSTSIISDIFALLLLAYFKRLHCTRNYIHMQLFVSFVLRGGSILVRDAILDPKITGGLEPGLGIRMNTTLLVLPESPTLLQLMECKTCMFMFLYFLATNYFWMLVEGLYLHSLIFLTFYSRRQCFLWFFTLIGWVLPLVFVFSWAVVRATIADSRCWDMETDNNYEWIYEGPILFSVVVNFLLLLNIVRVIMIKLNQNNAGHQQASQRHRKLIKSTLALMMLFGTHYVVGFGYEHFRTTMLWKMGMYFEIFFSSFMGFFVSLIYCFCNGEVQTEIKKAWTRWQLAHGSDFDGRLGRCGAGNLLPSFTSAASSVRSSLAAVGGSRRNEHRHHTSITDASSRISSQIVTDEAVQELPKYTK